MRTAEPGKSIFETEILRRKGLDVKSDIPSTSTEVIEIKPESLSEENVLKLSRMSGEDIEKARQEIYERFGISFLSQ